MDLYFTNTLTRTKEQFTPIDAENVRLYVCGINPYEHSHIGHARGYVVNDVLFRLLRHIYGENHVTYVRNFTDIEDNIIEQSQAAGEDFRPFTQRYMKSFHEDMAALNCLSPTHEPLATEAIPDIIDLIKTLVDKGVAYVSPTGDVNYDVSRAPKGEHGYTYGQLAGKKMDELIEGVRIEAGEGKKNPGDFALWKAQKPGEPAWDSPWGLGRPGWHIECSAMSKKYLGAHFDIHGGGEDLQFPHHENEIAQSEAAHCGCGHDHKDEGHKYVNYWMHWAFITVDGRKMSKSLGNFTTIKDALGQFSGAAIRLWLLTTHYRKPVDYSEAALLAAQKRVNKYLRAIESHEKSLMDPGLRRDDAGGEDDDSLNESRIQQEKVDKLLGFLADDLNTARALSVLDEVKSDPATLKACMEQLGLV